MERRARSVKKNLEGWSDKIKVKTGCFNALARDAYGAISEQDVQAFFGKKRQKKKSEK